MTKKTGILAVVVLIAMIFFGGVSYFSHKNSEKATVDKLATALIENDQAAIKRFMPRYSNKQKISREARQIFQQQFKKWSKAQVVEFL